MSTDKHAEALLGEILDGNELPPDFTDAEYEKYLRANPDEKKFIEESWERFLSNVVTCSLKYDPHMLNKPDGHKCTPPLMSARSCFEAKT